MTRCAERLRHGTLAAVALLLAACSTPPAKTGPAKPETAPTPAAPVADKGDPDQRFKDALALMKQKQNPQALAAFKKLSEDFPDYSGPLTDLGILYAQGKQRDPAISALSRATDKNPKNAVAYNWLGILYRESGEYGRAEQAYQKAIAAQSDYAPAHFNLAILYDVYLNRPQAALDQYGEYLKLNKAEDLRVQAWMKALEPKVASAPPPVSATTTTEKKP